MSTKKNKTKSGGKGGGQKSDAGNKPDAKSAPLIAKPPQSVGLVETAKLLPNPWNGNRKADEGLLQSVRAQGVLQNLVANAVRHTPEGGRIALTAGPRDGRMRIVVRDSGPGIPAEHLSRVFDRFYKADASRTDPHSRVGSGLGLSIVKAIVERHGGTVAASNAADGGAEFTIELPAQPADPPAAT